MAGQSIGELQGAWSLLFRIALIVFPAWAGWLSIYMIKIDNRVTAIEANRFTSADGKDLYAELSMKANRDEVPPQWFQAKVSELSLDMKQIHNEIADVRTLIDQHLISLAGGGP